MKLAGTDCRLEEDGRPEWLVRPDVPIDSSLMERSPLEDASHLVQILPFQVEEVIEVHVQGTIRVFPYPPNGPPSSKGQAETMPYRARRRCGLNSQQLLKSLLNGWCRTVGCDLCGKTCMCAYESFGSRCPAVSVEELVRLKASGTKIREEEDKTDKTRQRCRRQSARL